VSNPWLVIQKWERCTDCKRVLADIALLHENKLYCCQTCAIVDTYDPADLEDYDYVSVEPKEISKEEYVLMQIRQEQLESKVRFVSLQLVVAEMHSTTWDLTYEDLSSDTPGVVEIRLKRRDWEKEEHIMRDFALCKDTDDIDEIVNLSRQRIFFD
jgi:hypothetical protein